MNTPISLPPGFIERLHVESGPIKRTGYPDFGVVFASSDEHHDPFFSPNSLLGAYVRKPGGTELFQIVGGYFFIGEDGKTDQRPVKTVEVFGVAADPAMGFEMWEEGNVLLHNHWKFKRSNIFEKTEINERKPYVENGWTFIVEGSDRVKSDYPESGDSLEILLDCPELGELEIEFGGETEETQPVNVKLSISGPEPDEYTWNWGDGSEQEVTNSPEAHHTYLRTKGLPRVEYEISVSASGPGGCQQAKRSRIEITGCPTLTASLHQELTKSTAQVVLNVEIAGPRPDSFQVDWGDDSGQETFLTFPIEHTYSRQSGIEYNEYPIHIRGIGPDVCEPIETIVAQIPGCPELSLSKDVRPMPEGLYVTLNGALKGPDPDRLSVDWGLGEGDQLFERFPISQVYPRLSGETELEYEIRVVATGPDVCEVSATEHIRVQGCPSLNTSVETEIGPDSVLVSLHGEIKGSPPESIQVDWGDGTGPISIREFPASHTYPRPTGVESQTFSIEAKLVGPDLCQAATTHELEVPGCPKLSLIKEENISPSGMQVVLDLEIEGPKPELFIIDWGDKRKATVTGKLPVSRNYPRPVRKDHRDYEIKLTATGPDGCQQVFQTSTRVVGCPRIKAKAKSDLFADRVDLEIAGNFEGPAPDEITIDWGDGTEVVVISGLPIQHSFTRPMGVDAEEYEIILRARGPLDCFNEFRHTETVPGCPVLTLSTETDLSATGLQLSLDMTVLGPAPEIFMIDWGDGKGATPTGKFPVSRNYPRPQGILEKSYDVEVKAIGPELCEQSLEANVLVPGCPALRLTQQEELSPTGMQVVLDLIVEGPEPDHYSLDWGDGRGAQPVADFPVSRNFQRPVGELEKKYDITVNGMGPDLCQTYTNAHITVPGCPLITMNTESELTPTELIVTLKGEITGPKPDQLWVDWGLGDRPVKAFPFTHRYLRPKGKIQETAAIKLTAKGPDVCLTWLNTSAEIPGCPIIEPNLKTTLSATHLTAVLDVGILGPQPDTFQVDWGDGEKPQTISRFPVIHQYERPHGRMYRDTNIQIVATGPDLCETSAVEPVRIPGCPVLETQTRQKLGPHKMGLELSVKAKGPQPEAYSVDWGDGTSPQNVRAFPVFHEYSRSEGVLQADYQLKVLATGPDECLTEAFELISVPGCPAIQIQARQWLAAAGLRVAVNVKIEGPRPEAFEIDWGDGSSREKVSEFPVDHVFERPVGIESEDFEINLEARGPKLCETKASHIVNIPGCPDLQLGVQEELTAEQMEVTLSMEVEGPVPDFYVIEWGDGTVTKDVKRFPQSFRYDRPRGEMEKAVDLVVKAVGPKKCKSDLEETIVIPGCPDLEMVKLVEIEPTRVKVTVGNRIRGPRPDHYMIDWGMGKGLEPLQEFPAQTFYPRPEGELQRSYPIVLLAVGPDKCKDKDEGEVLVPGCPVIEHKISTDLAADYLLATLDVSIKGPEPEEIWVDWGDHVEAVKVRQFPVTYEYPRTAGVAYRDYELEIKAVGPHGCEVERIQNVQVPGCPLVEILPETDLSADGMKVTLNANVAGPRPDIYIVNWGDGRQASPLKEFPVSRNYPRPAGEDFKDYVIEVTASGPDVCVSKNETSIRVPGCPRIRTVAQTELSATGMKVELDLEVSGPKPDLFVVDWGDDKGALPTTQFPVSRNFPRPMGEVFRNYRIEVRATGPDQCITETHTEVQVPGCPRISLQAETELTASGALASLDTIVEGPNPDLFIIDWGDDKGATTLNEMPASRNFPRPAGREYTDYSVTVRAVGPYECMTEKTLQLQIPGCPRVYLNLEEEVGPEEMLLTLKTRHEGPEPTAYLIAWEEGADFVPVEEFPVSYAYARPCGKVSEEKQLTLRATGPDLCLTESRAELTVPGCPLIELSAKNKLTAELMRVSLSVKTIGPEPDTLEVDWGEGGGFVPLGDFPYMHEYIRPIGVEGEVKEIRVKASGPQGCELIARTQVEVPGCPELTLQLLTRETYEGLEVTARIRVKGPEPDTYKVDWGNGKKAMSVESWPITWLYAYPPGKTHEYRTITVSSKGPDKCSATAEGDVRIPGCPTLEIRTEVLVNPETVDITLYGTSEGPEVDAIMVHWGDEKQRVEVERLPVLHTYIRPAGIEYVDYEIRVELLGIAYCKPVATETVRIPGCPVWELETEIEMLPTEAKVKLSGRYEGPPPEVLRVDWGDSIEEIEVLPAFHTYKRESGLSGETHGIRLISEGPFACSAEASTEVYVVGCPEIDALSN